MYVCVVCAVLVMLYGLCVCVWFSCACVFVCAPLCIKCSFGFVVYCAVVHALLPVCAVLCVVDVCCVLCLCFTR